MTAPCYFSTEMEEMKKKENEEGKRWEGNEPERRGGVEREVIMLLYYY